MHILDSYSLSTASKVGQPFILQKYFPMEVKGDYITLQTSSKQSKTYDYWPDVLDMVRDSLSKNNIQIVQIGDKDDRPLKGTYFTAGQTSVNQAAYIIANSIGHVGVDSFGVHVASSFDKPIVALYSNNYANNVGPYWGDKSKQILLEPDRKGAKPSFSLVENPKTINTIPPELIANSIFKVLDINHTVTDKTEYIGGAYPNQTVELVPDQVLESVNTDCLIVRMDWLHNENTLFHQLQRTNCSIWTDKPININLLRQFKAKIREVVYELKEDNDINFVENITKLGIPHVLITSFKGEKLNDLKFKYLDYTLIHNKIESAPEKINELKQKTGLKYTSNRSILSNGQIFPSKAAWLANQPVPSFDKAYCNVIDVPEFWEELEFFRIISTKQ